MAAVAEEPVRARKRMANVPYVVFEQQDDGTLTLVGGVTARPGISDELKEKEAIKSALDLAASRGDGETVTGTFLAFRGLMPASRKISQKLVPQESWD